MTLRSTMGSGPRLLTARLRRTRRPPTVTVIIPTYNWATVLPWSIGSVQAQTMQDWELWVIGDGCTDESEATVRAIDDPRVRWYNLAVNGRSQVGPNNVGLRLAATDRIAYLGHDDLWLPEHLELLSGALDGGAPFAFGGQLRIDPGAPPFVFPPADYCFTPSDWIGPTAVMHRRDLARAAGGWRFPSETARLDPEADLWSRLALDHGAPAQVSAVTSVKLPASMRSGVYGERPCDEQQLWWERVSAAPDSASFVAAALGDVDHRPPARYDIATMPEAFLDGSVGAAERHRVGRIHKGLDS